MRRPSTKPHGWEPRSCRAMPCSCSRACPSGSMPSARGAKPLIYAAATDYARGISPLSREYVIVDASQTTPKQSKHQHQTPRITRRSSMCGALAMLVSISALLGPALATAKNRSDSSSQRRPACAWLSLHHLRANYYSMQSGVRHAGLPRRGTTTTSIAQYVSRRARAWNVCMQYAACSWPASTTSAISSSRVLTHCLAICSRSELLHRGNT